MKYELPVVFCILTGIMGGAGSAGAQTLEEALVAAYQNNPNLMAQRASLRATDEDLTQALSNWRPTVEINADATRSDTFNSNRVSGFGSKAQVRTPRGVSLDITQPLYRGGRTVAATNKAENAIKAERAQLTSVEQTVLLNAVSAYVDVVRDQAVVDLNINNEQVLKRQLQATLDRFEVGEITRTDVSQARARLAGATADRIQAEGNLVTSRAAFQNVVGMAPQRLAAPEPPGDLPVNVSEVAEAAVVFSPAVIKAEFDALASIDNVKEVRGELLPTVNLFGRVRRRNESANNTDRFVERAFGAQLTVPLYQSGAVYSRLRQAKQQVSESRRNIDQARRDSAELATRTWESLQTASARKESFSAQVTANTIALEGVEREASVGSRTVLDILDAEQELLDAKVNLVRAKRDEIVAIFQVKETMGRLTARHLKLAVDFYDPGAHYREVRGKWFGSSSTGGNDILDKSAVGSQ